MRGYISGAGDGTRTRDNLLGRQGLYQLSYSRFFIAILAPKSGYVKRGVPEEEDTINLAEQYGCLLP